MSIIPDPDELLVCPYDPVHRVAAKKFPYHLNKCRKQYGKFGEYKSCPFNARHVIPAPEYQYHMETCESKAAIEMEIAFEQSRNDTTGVVKGCTDIPKSPEWIKPEVTENWDEDEAPPAFLPQPLQNKPPDNLHRPMPSRPLSRKSNDSPPVNRFPPPGEKKGGRNFQSPRSSRGRHMSHINRSDDHLLSTVKPSFTPSPLSDEILDQDEFPPLSSVPQPRHSRRKHEPKVSPGSHSPEIHSTFIPRTQPSVMTHPAQPTSAAQTLASFMPTEPTFSPQPQYSNQDQLSNVSSFENPPPPQHSLISQNASEQPTQQANSLVRPSLQNIPGYQPYFAPPTNPISAPIPNPSYPPHNQSIPTAAVPMPQQSFSQPPPAPLTGNQNHAYNLQQQHVPTQHYLPPQQDYLNPGMYVAPQATHAISPPVPNTLPPQQLHYNQPQFQTVPNHQLPYNPQTYPPQPQYANYPPSQYNAPQYVPQQYYPNVPQYNATVQNYQQMQTTTHTLAPGQLPTNPPYQPQYAESLIGSQVSVQRPPGPGLISEKNRNLLQVAQNLPPNDAYLSANSVPIKLAPAPQQQPSLNASQGSTMPWLDQTSVVSMGSQPPGTGRGRGRGLSPRASPKRADHALPATNPTHQPPPFMHSIVPQMEQLHLANPNAISVPQERGVSQFPQPPPHNFHSSQPLQTQPPLPLPTNAPPHQQHTLLQQHSANPPHNFTANHMSNPSFRGSVPPQNPQTRLPSHIAPQTAQQPRFSVSKIQSLKNSLGRIALLEQRKESQPLTEEEKELLKSKPELLLELGEM